MSFIPEAAGLIAENNVGPLRVNRPGAPVQNADGGCDYPEPCTFEVNPVYAQTVTGRELDALPEADRRKEVICVFSFVELLVSEEDNGSDQVEYRGRSYRCTKSEDFEQHGDVFFMLAVLEDTPFPSEWA